MSLERESLLVPPCRGIRSPIVGSAAVHARAGKDSCGKRLVRTAYPTSSDQAPSRRTAAGDDETYEDEYESGSSTGAGGSTTTTTTADGRRETAISGFAFEGTITVAAGTEVVWTNLDGAGHTVSAREGAFDSRGTLEQGQSFSFTFDRAGRYDFYCQIHPSMTGTVVVQ